MEKLNGKTSDITAGNVEKLRELFPEAFTEGKIDFSALQKALGESVDTENERYSMMWHGKSDAIKMALKQSTATLLPQKAESKDWDTTENLFIEGDNLEVLRVLQDSYRGKVKMIYIDPPYNTGHDFVYTDNFSDNIKNYKEKVCTAMQANADTSGRYHTNWLNMMYPRLRLARNLLRDDGVIFISIDDNEVTNLRKIADEIFGESNFISNLVWHSSTGGGIRSRFVNQSHQYVLCYAKNSSVTEMFFAPLSEDAKEQYKKRDTHGLYREKDFAWKNSSWGTNQKYFITCPDGEKVKPKDGYLFRFIRSTFDDALSKDMVVFKSTKNGPLVKENGETANWNIYIKKYLGDGTGAPATVIPRDIVGINNEGTTELASLFGNSTFFESPKNVRLLTYLFSFLKADGEIVLDFFAGSGTTAHAVMDLNAEDGGNRKWICVQIPEGTGDDSEACKAGYKTIADIGKERIRRAGEKIKKDYADKLAERATPLDTGFKVFALDETNFTQWDSDTKDIQASLLGQLNPLKESRTDLDAVYEVLLKYGIDPTTPIEELSLAGKKVFSLAESYLLICLEKKITLDTIEEMAKLAPHRAVFYDNGFADDTVKANAEQTLKKAGVKEIMVI